MHTWDDPSPQNEKRVEQVGVTRNWIHRDDVPDPFLNTWNIYFDSMRSLERIGPNNT